MVDRSPITDPRTRAADLFSRFADRIAAQLLRRYRGVDPDSVTDAVVEAILEVTDDPMFTPLPDEPLPHAIAERARQRLRIAIRSDTRRRVREQIYSERVTTRRSAAPLPLDELGNRDIVANMRERMIRTPEESAVFDHWLNGTTDPDELATQIGKPRAEIVAILARIRQRMKRERDRQMSSPEQPEGTR